MKTIILPLLLVSTFAFAIDTEGNSDIGSSGSSLASLREYPYTASKISRGHLGAQYVAASSLELTELGQELSLAIKNNTFSGCVEKLEAQINKEKRRFITYEETNEPIVVIDGDPIVEREVDICSGVATVKLEDGTTSQFQMSKGESVLHSSTFDKIIILPILAAKAAQKNDCGRQNYYLKRLWETTTKNNLWCK